ncbi:sugar-binding transcriptional regulator [Roseobacter sp. HKCCA0434]|uniref:sugar-binding transcriptional regulator n=1 Tax=Roseobacter sp. HKCCA0434 TaxID=3079297 RepID=UPI002905E0FC|nr:sugar-binding transcriptional regulator [Roseobacter sp. HKCCA0434]
MKIDTTGTPSRIDEAARAAWLYYVAGNRQDEIARKLGISRQSVQRLISLADSEGLVRVRIDHPIGRCMSLARQMRERFGLERCEVAPTDPDAPDLLTGVAALAAAEVERVLAEAEPKIIALGTGRALKACVEQTSRMDAPHHSIVSLLGNMNADGSATPYNAAVRLADRTGAKHYPFPLPVLAANPEELALQMQIHAVRNTLELCARADLTLVGIGQMDASAPIFVDGFVSRAEMDELQDKGATGEIISWAYDAGGRPIDSTITARVASAPLTDLAERHVIAVAVGLGKVPAIRAALDGRLITGLITSEQTAEALLST